MNKGTPPGEQAPAAGLGAVANSDLKSQAATRSTSFETVAGEEHLGARHAAAGRPARASERSVDGKKQKVCCHCGKDVAHEERFKDKAGYYWCMDCGVQENREKHAIGHAQEAMKCPDCAQSVPANQLVEYERVKLCNDCAAKRQKHAAREAARAAARQAAIAEAAIEEARHRRHMMIGAAIVAALAVAWALYVAIT